MTKFILVRMPVYMGVKTTSVTFHNSREEAHDHHTKLDGTWPTDWYIAEVVSQGYGSRDPDVKAQLEIEGKRP